MVEAKLLRKKLKNGLIVDKWDLVTIIEKQQAEIEALKQILAYEGIGVSQEYLDECVADLRKAQENERK
jgi:asparagine synthetase A